MSSTHYTVCSWCRSTKFKVLACDDAVVLHCTICRASITRRHAGWVAEAPSGATAEGQGGHDAGEQRPVEGCGSGSLDVV